MSNKSDEQNRKEYDNIKIEWIIYNTVALYAYNGIRRKNKLWYKKSIQEV